MLEPVLSLASALSLPNSGTEQACRAAAEPGEGQEGVGRCTVLEMGGGKGSLRWQVDLPSLKGNVQYGVLGAQTVTFFGKRFSIHAMKVSI